MIFRAVFAVAAVLALGGCATVFAPDPTPVPHVSTATPVRALACTAKNATVRNSEPQATDAGHYAVIEGAAARFDASGQNVFQANRAEPSSGVIDVTPLGLFDSLPGNQDLWFATVMDAVHSLGTLPENLGIIPGAVAVANSSELDRSNANNQTWVRGWVARTEIVPFQVNCPNGSTVRGAITSFDPASGVQLEFRCDTRSHPRDNAAQTVLRKLCDSAD